MHDCISKNSLKISPLVAEFQTNDTEKLILAEDILKNIKKEKKREEAKGIEMKTIIIDMFEYCFGIDRKINTKKSQKIWFKKKNIYIYFFFVL